MEGKSIRTEKKERLLSLDVLRGFDMFWITGGRGLVLFIANITGAGWLVDQMDHASWAGLHMYDLIFPLFMFLSGVAIPYAIISKLDRGVPKIDLLKKAFKRMVILVVLGIVYNGAFENSFADARFASVLGQIGIAYFFSSLIFLYSKSLKARILWIIGIMVSISVIQLFIPVPGVGAGVLTPEGCINGYLDRMFLPGKLYHEIYDNEGLLCIVSAISITMLGTFAGNFLRDKKYTDWQKVKYMFIAGTILILVAAAISPFYPVIKRCWTSSFVLLAGGLSTVLMALFYMIIDVIKWQKWGFFFRVIGMNSIFVYLFVRFINVGGLSKALTGWISTFLSADVYQFINNIGAVTITWLLLYYMFRKNIFLRV